MSKLSLIVVAAVTLVFGSPPAAQAVTTTLDFTGMCETGVSGNCTGTGNGSLVLFNFTPGAPLSIGNFISFDYSSNVIPSLLVVNPTLGPSPPGSLPITQFTASFPALPGPADVTITAREGFSFVEVFGSNVEGTWCAAAAGVDCNQADLGNKGTYTETPLPAALPLFATGIGALGLLGWRRKRRAQAVA